MPLGLARVPLRANKWFSWLVVALTTSAMMGDSPVLLLVLPEPEELTAISMWTSPSAEMLLCGKRYCQSAENCGYWALASDEIWTLSTSHKEAMNEISERVLVIVVVPWQAGWTRATT